LAGAQAVQMVSAFYKNKIEYLQDVINFIGKWMAAHNFETLQEFRGKLSQPEANDPAVYERVHLRC
jgi:dihydroorotate dehydrogenase (fumarate)